MSTIRVLLITNGFAVEGPLGGVERFGIELASALPAAGDASGLKIEPILSGLWAWGTPHEQTWQQHVAAQGVHPIVGPRKDDASPLANFRDAVQMLRRDVVAPIDIIHSHSEFGDVTALWLRRAFGARAVVRTVHNEREWPKRPLRRRVLTQTLYPLLFDAEFGVSQRVVDNLNRRPLAQLGQRLGVKPPAQVMYNALNFARFDEHSDGSNLRAELGIPADVPLVGSVGRLVPQKDYATFLHAAAIVLAERSHIYFVLVGEGEQRGELEAQAQRLGIAQHVIFTGAQPNVERFFAAFDLFVSSSRWEGLPTVILEAMAAGVPVVATDVSGSRELVADGHRGRLVPLGDVDALARAIVDTLAAPKQAYNLALAAQHFARTQFSIETVADAHVRLYRQLVGLPSL